MVNKIPVRFSYMVWHCLFGNFKIMFNIF